MGNSNGSAQSVECNINGENETGRKQMLPKMFTGCRSFSGSSTSSSDTWEGYLRFVYNAEYLYSSEYKAHVTFKNKDEALNREEFSDQRIKEFSIYRTPLKPAFFGTISGHNSGEEYSMFKGKLCHLFLLIETDQNWFGLAKSSSGTEILCAQSPEGIWKSQIQWEDHQDQKYRDQAKLGDEIPFPQLALQYSGEDLKNTCLKDVISWMYDSGEVTQKYSFLFNNCKHFVHRVIQQFTRKTVPVSYSPSANF